MVRSWTHGRWPRGRQHCCCCRCSHCLVSRPSPLAARRPAAATAPRWSAGPCGFGSSRLESRPGRRWALGGAATTGGVCCVNVLWVDGAPRLGRLPRWLEQPPSLPLACRRYSCRTTASRTWSQASWRLLPPCAVSTCTTTACAPWSQAPLVRSHACWSWHSQATGCVACVWAPSPAWPSCAYST